jgi:hypothetical protein
LDPSRTRSWSCEMLDFETPQHNDPESKKTRPIYVPPKYKHGIYIRREGDFLIRTHICVLV